MIEPHYTACAPCCKYRFRLPRRVWTFRIAGGVVYQCYSCRATWFVAKHNLADVTKYALYPEHRKRLNTKRRRPMNTQTDLFAWQAKSRADLVDEHRETFADADKRTIQARFEEFHRKNPMVYQELVKLCRQWRKRGNATMGIRMAWEVMRWNILMSITRVQADDFKLNDHYHSRYARMIMEQERDLEGIFELRELRA